MVILAALTTPMMPAIAAPTANAWSFAITVLMPADSAASSSSRIASHVLPTRESSSLNTIIAISAKMISTRTYIGQGLVNVNCKIPGIDGLSMPPRPLVPLVNLSAFKSVIGTISPKPSVTIAR